MKKLAVVVASVLGVLVLLFVGVAAMSPSGEVVTLVTTAPGGGSRETSLWVVDEGDVQWLRAGHPNAAWVGDLRADPRVEFVRGDTRGSYRVVLVDDPPTRERINAAMAEKYGASNRVVSLWSDHSTSLPIRLEPR